MINPEDQELAEETPLVSIITPSFNQGQFLEETICSVLGQDYPRIEYIIMDGGSTDESLEVIRRYQRQLAYWESKSDLGQAHAVNKGLAMAKGSILGWLNSDDILLRETVSRIVRNFQLHPAIDVIYGRLERIDESGIVLPTPNLPKDRLNFSRRAILGECVVNQPGCFWRRSVMSAAGFLDESLNYVMDYEYWIRLALSGAQFMRLPEVVARFRLSKGSKTVSKTAEMAKEQLDILNKLIERKNLTEELEISPQEIKRQSSRTKALICLHCFYGEIKRGDGIQALHWLLEALKSDASVVLDRRWAELAWARLRR